jgi:hypothetical protein
MSNYSYETSLPAYKDEVLTKKRQADEILKFIVKGANNLLQLSQITGLPQSTIAGRCNDLKFEGKIMYNGFTYYQNRQRKKIVAIQQPPTSTQSKLFSH